MCNDLMTGKKLSTSNAAALNPIRHDVVLILLSLECLSGVISVDAH
jgi:hypothetical protein